MGDLDLIAFLDESKKPVRNPATGKVSATGEHYVVAGAIVLSGDANTVREGVRDLRRDLGYPLHYSELRSRTRRETSAKALAALPGWDGHLFETARALHSRHHSEHHVRAKALETAFTQLGGGHGVQLITLETRAKVASGLTALDQKDHRVLQSLLSRQQVPLGMRITHADKSEPLLWIADILAGARSDYLCAADRTVYGLLAHRVQSIHTVFN